MNFEKVFQLILKDGRKMGIWCGTPFTGRSVVSDPASSMLLR